MERAALAATLAFLLVLLSGRTVIAQLAAWNIRQAIREEAPERHRGKAGTPTVGGLLLLVAAIVGTVVAARPGLQVALVLLVLPWLGRVNLGWVYVPFGIAFVLGFVNAVNLADGLDGLAAGLSAITAGAYAAIAFRAGWPDLGLLGAGLAGACVGFLWFNAHPAEVFMGDTGSNALGAGLAGLALLTKTELTMVVVGAVFVAEAVSVLGQVAYFKATGGRRIFRMSPLHHHFELGGWTETQTVTRFWLLAALAALIGLLIVF